MNNCIFCSIISGSMPATKIAENDHVIVIKDIHPKAPIHHLIIPKKHLESLHAFEDADKDTAAAIMLMANQLSKKLTDSKAFRIVINNGYDAGQRVFHAHAHFLAGKQMSDF